MSEQAKTLATTEQLLSPSKRRRYDTVELPVSGLTVRIQSLTELEVNNYQMAVVGQRQARYQRDRLRDATRRLIVLCVVDAVGNRLLSDKHVKRLAEWDAADTQVLYDACAKHVGLNTDDIDQLIEEAGKNSATIPDDSSPTDAPSAPAG